MSRGPGQPGTTAEGLAPPGGAPALRGRRAAGPGRPGGLRRRARRLGRTALAASPHALLFSAVVQKEMRVAGRRRSTYWFRFLYAAALIALASLVFMSATQSAAYVSPAARLQRLQGVAPQLSYFIVGFQFWALALAAPILTAGSISDERHRRTLAALATTPLTSGQIVFGKLFAGVVQLVVLSLIPLPLLMGARLFGGLEAGVVVATFSVNLSVAFLGAALGVWNSTRVRRTTSAILLAMLGVAAAQVGPILLYGLSTRFQSGPPPGWLFATCSPFVLVAVCEPMARAGLGANITALWTGACVYNLALSLLALMLATGTLRRVIRADAGESPAPGAAPRRRGGPAPAGPAPPEPGEAARPEAPAAPDASPGRPPPARASREVGDQPVLWRELRQPAFGARWKAVASWVAVGALLLWLYVRVGLNEGEMHAAIAVIGVVAMVLQAALNTTGGVAAEREARSLPVLLTTDLSPREIVAGKFAGTLRRQWFIPAALAAHFAVGVGAGWVSPWYPLLTLVIVSGPVAMLSATGLLWGVLFRKSTTAAIVNFLFASGVYLAPWLFLFTVGALFRVFDEMEPLLNFPFAFNPAAMTASAGQALKDAGWAAGGRVGDFELPSFDVGPGGLCGIVAAVWAAYAAAAGGALALAVRFLRPMAARE